MYLIRRKSDNRLIAGVFMPIKTIEMAERVMAEWSANYPDTEFVIDTKYVED
jgi:hypothetical protein